jgi:hypothetical protein
MIQLAKDSIMESSPQAPVQIKKFQPWPVIMLGLMFAAMACSFGGPTAERVVMITRLPAVTRTPLPTLTPTPLVTGDGMIPVGVDPGALAAPALTQSNNPPAPGGGAAQMTSPMSAPLPVDQTTNPTAVANSAQTGYANAEAGNSALPAGETPRSQQAAVPTATPASGPGFSAVAAPQLIVPNPAAAPVVAGSARPFVTPTPRPTGVPVPTRMSTAAPVINQDPTATPDFRTSGWSFASVRVNEGSGNGLLLYGEVINDTGSTQELHFISGTFYNDQGQIIANQNNTSDFAPVYQISSGVRVPFELAVNNIGSAARFDLWARSESSNGAPRRDNFEFLDVIARNENNLYCLTGSLANRGNTLNNYVDIVAILYDDRDSVISFDDSYQADVGGILGDTTLPFEICVNSGGGNVARYDLRAWGQ